MSSLFLFTAPATTAIYTLSLHDALPIFPHPRLTGADLADDVGGHGLFRLFGSAGVGGRGGLSLGDEEVRGADAARSEEHTSELQSQSNLVCRLLLEKKKKKNMILVY